MPTIPELAGVTGGINSIGHNFSLFKLTGLLVSIIANILET